MSLIRTCLVGIGVGLLAIAMICMGLDLIASLAADGILTSASLKDITLIEAPVLSLCPRESGVCYKVIHSLLQLYAWIIPGVCGLLLIWGAGFSRPK